MKVSTCKIACLLILALLALSISLTNIAELSSQQSPISLEDVKLTKGLADRLGPFSPIEESLELGVSWARVKGDQAIIETSKGVYDFSELDLEVSAYQALGGNVLITIFPKNREKPSDVEAYKQFVKALVERYDGDGYEDSPLLKYPVKYWEVMNEPDIQFSTAWMPAMFKGPPEDYVDVLKATYEAIKEADPEAKVVIAAPSVINPSRAPPDTLEFWKEVMKHGAGNYFDVGNVHFITGTESEYSEDTDFDVSYYKELLSSYGVEEKPLIITELQLGATESGEEKQARVLVKGCVRAFAEGVDFIMYVEIKALEPSIKLPEELIRSFLIDLSGRKRPVFYAFKTMSALIGDFQSVVKLSEGCYKFKVYDADVYVLWNPGVLPSNVTGTVTVVDMYGNVSIVDASQVQVSNNPIYVISYAAEKVKEAIQMSCSAQPAQIVVGEQVNITGFLTPAIENLTIILSITSPENQTTTVNVTTDEQGVFYYTFTPSTSGTWNITAYYPGDEQYQEASFTLELQVTSAKAEVKVTVKVEKADINNDSIIDLGDLQVLKSAYGLTQYHVSFKPEADLNDDGTIDILDLAILAYFYGREIEVEVKVPEKPGFKWTSNIQPGSGLGVPPFGIPEETDGPWKHRVLMAYSQDGLTWSKNYTILADQASVPDAIIDSDGYIRVYYVDYYNGGISVAISEDGVSWVYLKVEGLDPCWVDPDVVLLPDGRYRLYASYMPLTGPQNKIVSAISDDGVHFEVEEGIRYIDPTGTITDPDVIWAGDKWVMFVSKGEKLVMLTSEDGLNFSKVKELDFEGAVSCTIPFNNGYRIYFHHKEPDRPVRIYSSFTQDFENWTSPTVVLKEGSEGSLDRDGVADPAVIRLPEGGYLMFYKTWITQSTAEATEVSTETSKAKSIFSCCVIDKPGTYMLSNDIPCSETCITISANNVTIDGRCFSIEGNKEGYGIYAKQVENLTIKNLKISKCRLGIYLEDVKNVVVENVIVEDNEKDGISVNFFFNVTVRNCTLSKNSGTGFSAIGAQVTLPEKPEEMPMPENFSQKLVVVGCKAEDNAIDGFFTLAVKDLTLLNCVEQGGSGGIYPFFSINGVIENCTANYNEYVGICLCRCENITIFNCTAVGNAGGIRMESENITVENCTLRNNGDGIFLKLSSNVVIRNNLFVGNHYGIHLAKSHDNIIENNSFLNNEVCNIYSEP